MTPAGALCDLVGRLGANGGKPLSLAALELETWPAEFVQALKHEGLITAAAAARTVLCQGCEAQCLMPVEVRTAKTGAISAFVVCDKRDDIHRVEVEPQALTRWQTSGYAFAQWLAQQLDPHPPVSSTDESRGCWRLGVVRLGNHSVHVELAAGPDMSVVLDLGARPRTGRRGAEGPRGHGA